VDTTLSRPEGPRAEAQGPFHFDEATGLPGRADFMAHIEAAMRQARRDGHEFALLAIDVAKLVELRSALEFGLRDSLAMAMAMAARLHAGSAAGQRVAHLGGSGFAALLPTGNGQTCEALRERAQALRAALQAPVTLAGTEVLPEVLIGVALFPADSGPAEGHAAEALLAAAQAALADAQATGGVSFSRRELNAPAQRELQHCAALRQAIEQGALSLAYQPKVSLETGTIVGTEALPHWTSEEWGDCSGTALSALAERSGQITAFGDWMLRQVGRQTVAWRQAGLAAGPVCVNVTPLQFRVSDVARQVQAALIATGAEPGDLGIELTEAALLPDVARATRVLNELTAIGVGITLDDFGTGYSSLTSLALLPIQLIKIDRSLVPDVTASPDEVSVTRAIIRMAHDLQRPVIADGVETEGQVGLLSAKGCDQVQGSCFSPPVSAEALAELLRQRHRLPAHLLRAREHRRTLLLVDDEDNILSALKRLLRRDGYQIVTARNGPEGLQRLAEHPVDVILSDQRMPGMSGVEFLRQAKALYPDTVRMTLSGFTDLQSIIDAVNEGAIYKFLTKPWDDELLRSHLAQAFAQKEMADENKRLTTQLAGANAELETLNTRLAVLLEAQQAQSRLLASSASGTRDLLDHLPAAVLGIDPDGMLAYANRAAARWVPGAAQAIGGPAEAGQPLMQALARLQDGQIRRVKLADRHGWASCQRLQDEAPGVLQRGRVVLLVPSDPMEKA